MRRQRTIEERLNRYAAVGGFLVAHWRGVLLSVYIGTLAISGLLAFWGYSNRDEGWGAFLMTVFGILAVAMALRPPRRLLASMRAQRRLRRGDGVASGGGPRPGVTPPGRGRIVDVTASDARADRTPEDVGDGPGENAVRSIPTRELPDA